MKIEKAQVYSKFSVFRDDFNHFQHFDQNVGQKVKNPQMKHFEKNFSIF